ncbi:MAG: hypothetical protein CSYNP_00438 [Syntrophus sp. SKADARSKE-3]|nr:hypothetical protein [Syntrophus sp. SKADARSKE-3]
MEKNTGVNPSAFSPLSKDDSRIETALQWKVLRKSPTQSGAWLALAKEYERRGMPWQAGYAARQAFRCDNNLLESLRELRIGNWQDIKAGDAMLGFATLPEAEALADRFEMFVAECPDDWLTWLYLLRLYDMLTNSEKQKRALLETQFREIIPGESLHWLGVWRLNAGDTLGAVAAFSGLLNVQPLRCGSMMYLGEALLRVGNIAAAEKAFQRASASKNPDFLLTLAIRVFEQNYCHEAIEILRKALQLRPDSLEGWLRLSKIQWETYDLSDAEYSCRRILELDPGNKDAAFMLAALPGRMGDAKGHMAAVQAEYENGGDPLSRLGSGYAMVSLYLDDISPSEIASLHRRICKPIEAVYTVKKDFTNTRVANRRLRVGYLTGDLHRQHPVNIFMLPVLQHHDHERFEIFVYHTGAMHDLYTQKAKDCSDCWREAAKMDDNALRSMMIDDGIDVLVDLAGHTSSHRLGILAMRAAPVQVTFLGYPHSTGLSTIDCIIGDPMVTPAEHAELYSEGIAQLPNSVFCWASVDNYPLPQPRVAGLPPVFGSFNNVMKISPRTVALWARVLKAVPESQLLLKAPSLKDSAVMARFEDLFAQSGIARERLIMRGPTGLADMMQEYGDIDIALDTWPYNGGTTSLQALWMGVPLVSLAGGNFVSRMGASFLKSMGRAEWATYSEDGYVKKAAELAENCDELRKSRQFFRSAMETSPLCDIRTYTSDLEILFKQMWSVYCSGQTSRFLSINQAGC